MPGALRAVLLAASLFAVNPTTQSHAASITVRMGGYIASGTDSGIFGINGDLTGLSFVIEQTFNTNDRTATIGAAVRPSLWIDLDRSAVSVQVMGRTFEGLLGQSGPRASMVRLIAGLSALGSGFYDLVEANQNSWSLDGIHFVQAFQRAESWSQGLFSSVDFLGPSFVELPSDVTATSGVTIRRWERQATGTALTASATFTGRPTFLSVNGGQPSVSIGAPAALPLLALSALLLLTIRRGSWLGPSNTARGT